MTVLTTSASIHGLRPGDTFVNLSEQWLWFDKTYAVRGVLSDTSLECEAWPRWKYFVHPVRAFIIRRWCRVMPRSTWWWLKSE